MDPDAGKSPTYREAVWDALVTVIAGKAVAELAKQQTKASKGKGPGILESAAEKAIYGVASDNDTAAAIVADVGVGVVPVVGQAADVRDVILSAEAISREGFTLKNTLDLVGSTVGFVPLAGDLAKQGIRGVGRGVGGSGVSAGIKSVGGGIVGLATEVSDAARRAVKQAGAGDEVAQVGVKQADEGVEAGAQADDVVQGASAANGPARIDTPYGPAVQSTSMAAAEARIAAQQGATLYRGGVLNRSAGPEAQFWSLEDPLSPGYAAKYGIPAENVTFDFVETATLRPGAKVITRKAPGVDGNAGGAIEVVVEPGGVKMRGFFMP
jgi:hypothetical protein